MNTLQQLREVFSQIKKDLLLNIITNEKQSVPLNTDIDLLTHVQGIIEEKNITNPLGVKQAQIEEDLFNVLTQLDAWLHAEDMETKDRKTIRQEFETICVERIKKNKNTILCISLNPEAYGNSVFLSVAEVLFTAKDEYSFYDLIRVLMPDITEYYEINLERALSSAAKRKKLSQQDLVPSITIIPITTRNSLCALPPRKEYFTELVFTENGCCLLSEVQSFNIIQHNQFYELLLSAHYLPIQQADNESFQYLGLLQAIRSYNESFAKLYVLFDGMKGRVRTIREQFIIFLDNMKTSGSSYSGTSAMALPEGTRAAHEFLQYVDSLPEELALKVKQCGSPEFSHPDGLGTMPSMNIERVCQLIKEEHCINNIQIYLKSIINNPSNRDVLDQRPLLNKEENESFGKLCVLFDGIKSRAGTIRDRYIILLNNMKTSSSSYIGTSATALSEGSRAAHEFLQYVDSLPEELALKVKQCGSPEFAHPGGLGTMPSINIERVCQLIKEEHCINNIQLYLKAIIDNPVNRDVLDQHPLLNKEENEILQRYARQGIKIPFEFKKQSALEKLPLVEGCLPINLLKRIGVSSIEDYLQMLRLLPLTKWPLFCQSMQINPYSIALNTNHANVNYREAILFELNGVPKKPYYDSVLKALSVEEKAVFEEIGELPASLARLFQGKEPTQWLNFLKRSPFHKNYAHVYFAHEPHLLVQASNQIPEQEQQREFLEFLRFDSYLNKLFMDVDFVYSNPSISTSTRMSTVITQLNDTLLQLPEAIICYYLFDYQTIGLKFNNSGCFCALSCVCLQPSFIHHCLAVLLDEYNKSRYIDWVFMRIRERGSQIDEVTKEIKKSIIPHLTENMALSKESMEYIATDFEFLFLLFPPDGYEAECACCMNVEQKRLFFKKNELFSRVANLKDLGIIEYMLLHCCTDADCIENITTHYINRNVARVPITEAYFDLFVKVLKEKDRIQDDGKEKMTLLTVVPQMFINVTANIPAILAKILDMIPENDRWIFLKRECSSSDFYNLSSNSIDIILNAIPENQHLQLFQTTTAGFPFIFNLRQLIHQSWDELEALKGLSFFQKNRRVPSSERRLMTYITALFTDAEIVDAIVRFQVIEGRSEGEIKVTSMLLLTCQELAARAREHLGPSVENIPQQRDRQKCLLTILTRLPINDRKNALLTPPRATDFPNQALPLTRLEINQYIPFNWINQDITLLESLWDNQLLNPVDYRNIFMAIPWYEIYQNAQEKSQDHVNIFAAFLDKCIHQLSKEDCIELIKPENERLLKQLFANDVWMLEEVQTQIHMKIIEEEETPRLMSLH